jgi:hypothetical protein
VARHAGNLHGSDVVRFAAYGACVQRLRSLSEAECYARCYGWRGEDGVKVIAVERRRPRYETPVSGELLRSLFETKLDSREPEAA